MFTRKFVVVAALAAGALAPAASLAATGAEKPPCILRDYQVKAVTPYRLDAQAGKISYKRLAGARVFLEAQPGLTAEWLRVRLGRHMAEMRGPATMRDCAFDMKDVNVQVDPAGTGFNVTFTAKDTEQAKEVLRRAQLLLG
jgi:hypothetical protein